MKNIVTHNKNNDYSGYLGNRMFQYASTIGIAVKNGKQFMFPPHDYLYNFKGDFFVNPNLKNIQTNNLYIYEFHYREVELNRETNYNITGYLQSEKYFKHCEHLIRELFQFNEAIKNIVDNHFLGMLAKNTNAVSIHVRRGDYLNLPNHHPVLSIDYYKLAIEQFDDGQPFLVFSDDTNFCDQNFQGDNFHIVHGFSPAQDMYLMSLCKGGSIIANSSFSWWGAWLANNKKVIAPNKWFGDAYSHFDTNDLYLDKWTRI